jgi:hypothetical protein
MLLYTAQNQRVRVFAPDASLTGSMQKVHRRNKEHVRRRFVEAVWGLTERALGQFTTRQKTRSCSMATAVHEPHELLTAPFFTFTERNRAMLEKAVRTTQEETLEFLNRNLERNVKTLERLRHCDGVSELMAVDHQWFSDVMRDSFEHTQRVAKMWWRLTEEELDAQADTARQEANASAAVARRQVSEPKRSQERAAA